MQESRPELKQPPMFKVVILNDDYTPMEFVVIVLETFFSMSRENATRVMLHVHTQGRGVCGIFTRDVADTKVAQVNAFSRAHQHPLMCAMEEARHGTTVKFVTLDFGGKRGHVVERISAQRRSKGSPCSARTWN